MRLFQIKYTYRYLPSFLIMLCIASCSTDTEEEELLPENTIPIKELRMEPRGTYPEILDASIPKLRPNTTPWESSEIFCSENIKESFHQIRVIERAGEISYIVFSSIDENNGFSFFFNEYDGMGQLMSRHALDGATIAINSPGNLLQKDGFVFYYTNSESRQVKYFSLVTGEHGDTLVNVFSNKENEDMHYPSPSANKVIVLYDTKLVLKDLTDKSRDTLINQEYRGSWSFGQGCWNYESTKFYFDNSGAVACIWEIDIEKKTLNKIVPEHDAAHPYYFQKDGTAYIAYCENNCIKLTTPAKQE